MANTQKTKLSFVTSNEAKYYSYCTMLGLSDSDMAWRPVLIPDVKEIYIPKLAQAKLEYTRKEVHQFPFFVEQGGLAINAWKGLPGGFSRMFIDTLGPEGICKMMSAFKGDERNAQIQTIIYYVKNAKGVDLFGGGLRGSISMEPKGDKSAGSFGWDQIFIPEGYTQTLAQLGLEKKYQILVSTAPVSEFRQFVRLKIKPPTHPLIPTMPLKILFLAANPSDTRDLKLVKEFEVIDHALRESDYGHQFDIKQEWGAHFSELPGHLLRYTPHIVHFSGHGSDSSEMILEGSSAESQPVSTDALSELFKILKDNIQCVVLNACYSETQAQAIAQSIDCVIGMSKDIGDSDAISFSEAFYQALGYGKDVQTAFDLGRKKIRQGVPKLICLTKNPHDIKLVQTL